AHHLQEDRAAASPDGRGRCVMANARVVKQNQLPGTNYIRKVPGPELELVELTPDGEFVLRDESGSVSVVPPFNTEVYVAVQCQRCRRFGGDVSAMDAGGWTCYGEDGEGACRKAKDLEAWDRRHEEH